jgi:capsular exopolysaccharide synthesis family protein
LNTPFNQNDENVNILQTIRGYITFWPLFVVVTFLTLTISYFYLKYTPRVFQISSKLLVQDQKKGVSPTDLLESLDVMGESTIIENEIEVLKSWPIVQKVVIDLRLYTRVYKENIIKDNFAYGVANPISLTAKYPDSLTESGELSFVLNWGNKTIFLKNKLYKEGDWIDLGELNKFILRFNPKYIHKNINNYALKIRPVSAIAQDFIKNVQIKSTSTTSTVINIDLESENPKRDIDLINTLLIEYQKSTINDKNLSASNTLTFLNKRIEVLSSELTSIESEIERFKVKENLFDLSEQSKILLNAFQSKDIALGELDLQLSLLDQVESYVLKKGFKEQTSPSLLGLNDPGLTSLLTKLQETGLSYGRLEKTTGYNNDVLVQLRAEIQKLQTAVTEMIANNRKSLKTSIAKLKSDLNSYDNELNSIPQKERTFVQINRQQIVKNTIYNFLLSKREETELSLATSVNDSKVIEGASSSVKPIRPVIPLVVILGFLSGISISVIIVVIGRLMNQKILTKDDIKGNTEISVLGEVIQSTELQNNIFAEKADSLIAEQFRNLRSQLGFLIPNQKQKTLVVTSSIPGEGKSFTATNLALSISLLGINVALIELDLRKPKIMKTLGIQRPGTKIGLSSVLAGQSSLEDIIIKVDTYPNLFVIPAGITPPNPTELISSPQFGAFITQLKQQFDYVIIDTPPISLFSDALLINEFADASLFVVRQNYTPKESVANLNQLYVDKRVKNAGIIFNGINPDSLFNYGYGYSYHYNYSYSYRYGYGSYGKAGDKKVGLIPRLVKRLKKMFSTTS